MGNYWAYHETDTAGNPLQIDSIKIVGYTIINSVTCYNITGGIFEGGIEGYDGDSAVNIITWPGSYDIS